MRRLESIVVVLGLGLSALAAATAGCVGIRERRVEIIDERPDRGVVVVQERPVREVVVVQERPVHDVRVVHEAELRIDVERHGHYRGRDRGYD